MAGLSDDEKQTLIRQVKARCVEQLAQAYEDAGVQGLCAEGRWEAALGALERLDAAELLGLAAQPTHARATPTAGGATAPPRCQQHARPPCPSPVMRP